MAKRPSKHLRPPRPLSDSLVTAADKVDGGWMVQAMPAGRALKAYRCPGCEHEIRPGTPHVVAWPRLPGLLSASGVEERRHWHTACWNRRR